MTASLAVALAQEGPATWDWEFVWDILPALLRGLWVTVQITVFGVVLALTGGLVLAMLRRSRLRVVRWPVGFVVEFVRSTPLLVQLFFVYYAGPGIGITLPAFTTAWVILGIHYACYTSETYRAGIESVPRGQWEASTALNLSTATTWRTVVLPQAIPTVLPALGNYVVAALKDAPLAASITVVGILGAALRAQSQYFRGLEPFTLAGVLFLAVSVPASMLVRLLERRHGYQRD